MKANAVSTLRTWKAEQEAEVKRREDSLTAELKALIPQVLKAWIEEDMGDWVIDTLIKVGRCNSKYSASQEDQLTYSYTDLREFEQRFVQLKTAWKDVVNISFVWDEDYQFRVIFIVI